MPFHSLWKSNWNNFVLNLEIQENETLCSDDWPVSIPLVLDGIYCMPSESITPWPWLRQWYRMKTLMCFRLFHCPLTYPFIIRAYWPILLLFAVGLGFMFHYSGSTDSSSLLFKGATIFCLSWKMGGNNKMEAHKNQRMKTQQDNITWLLLPRNIFKIKPSPALGICFFLQLFQ